MRNPVKETIIEVVKVSIVVLTVLWLSPHLQKWFPGLPEFPSYLITTLIGATVLEIVWLLLFLRPIIAITWTADDDPDDLDQITVRFNAATNESVSSFGVHVRGVRATGLGWLVVRVALRNGLILNVIARNTNIVTVVDDYNPGPDDQPLATSMTHACGIELKIPGPFSQQSLAYARVRFRSRGTARHEEYELGHELVASPGIGAWCASLIHVDKKATSMRERWS